MPNALTIHWRQHTFLAWCGKTLLLICLLAASGTLSVSGYPTNRPNTEVVVTRVAEARKTLSFSQAPSAPVIHHVLNQLQLTQLSLALRYCAGQVAVQLKQHVSTLSHRLREIQLHLLTARGSSSPDTDPLG